MASDLKSHKFKVEMTCEGCKKAISNILNKHKDQGIPKYEINLEEKLVTVTSSLEKDQIMEIIKKSGMNVNYIEEK